MKITLSLIVSVILVVTFIAGAFSFFQIHLLQDEQTIKALALLQSGNRLAALQKKILMGNFIFLIVLLVPTVLMMLWIVRRSVKRPMVQIAEKLRRLRLGEDSEPLNLTRLDVVGPLAAEVNHIAKSLAAARNAAEAEARLRLSAEAIWTPEKLKEHVRTKLGDKSLFVVSNREPYMHVRRKGKIQCVVPPSGLVTALEPVMRACGGLWIAHGSGDADRESSDDENKVRVPPNEPAYTLKRVWLTKEEENGHYYGFSNEGLWPLCHITHTRPIFRLEDWNHYQRVNEKFADSLLEEIKDEESPLLFIQDYHFALLPRLIRQRRPDARIAIFWHIPRPNPESFSICPWKNEILSGMLGADIIGFHIRFHCNNFLDTVDSTLESKIDWEHFSVERSGQLTRVLPYPISVNSFAASSSERTPGKTHSDSLMLKQILEQEYGLTTKILAVGVDRLDYTKGIIERLRAIERFLEKYPEYIGQFTYVELGAISRESIQKYRDFVVALEAVTDQINSRFQTKEWKPIFFLKGQHSHEEITPFYKAADICLVTSLHDGMNLVAKEFVSARSDENGVLVLSQFTGASRELRDALIVNPYDIESMAECIRLAIEMPKEEKQDRMKRMRAVVRERNIYRWAANLITDISKLPSQKIGQAVGA